MANSRTGFLWVYCVVILFAASILELVVMPAVQYKLVPSLQSSANITLSAVDAAEFATKMTNVIHSMHLSMYVLMFVILVYLLLSVFRREENEFYQP